MAQLRTNTDATLYNKYLVGRVETFQRVEILSIMWEQRSAIAGNITSANMAVVYIPFARGDDCLAPREWQALADKSDKWTIQIGDVIVKGLVEDELVAGVFTLSNLKAAYDDVMVITSVDTNDFGSVNMQHWEVTAQ